MTKRKIKFKSAWIVFDGEKPIDILSGRYDFDAAYKYIQDLYCTLHLSLSEKLSLAHYTEGSKQRQELFKVAVPVFTSYQTKLYRALTQAMDKDINSAESRQFLEQWSRAPEYISVGHNPTMEIRKVFNIEERKENDNRVLVYENPQSDGSRKVVKYALI